MDAVRAGAADYDAAVAAAEQALGVTMTRADRYKAKRHLSTAELKRLGLA